MSRRYRILHLITLLELGGAQQNTLFCVTHHDRRRFDVGLIAGRGGYFDDQALDLADASVELVSYLKHPVSPFWDAVALLRLRSYLKLNRVDLIHTHSSKAGIVGRLAAHLAGVPAIVHTAHGWSFNATQPAWRRALYIALERMAGAISDRLIVVASAHKEVGLDHGVGRAEQYALLRSGIELDAFRTPRTDRRQTRRNLGFDDTHRVVGTIACMKPQKAPLDFVRAAAAASGQDSRLRFFIAGDGELMPRVRALVQELGLEEQVRLLGWRTDVVDLLHAMDVFLLTSLFEGLPRVVLQAMAAGVPVVATAVDGTPEVVEHGRTGLLTPPGDPRAAAQRVLQMVRDESLRRRCSEQARECLTRHFDIRRMVRDLDDLYLSLLDRPTPSCSAFD